MVYHRRKRVTFKRRYRRKRRTRKQYTKAKGSRTVMASVASKPITQRPPLRWNCPGGELPDRVLLKMRYGENNIARAPALTGDVYTFMLNGIHDPNITGTGGQPSLHDAMADLFDRYRVNACIVKAHIRNTCASPILVGLNINDDNLSGSPQNLDIVRRSSHKSMILGKADSDHDSGQLIAYVNMKKFFKWKSDSANSQASFGSNPSDGFHVNVFANTMDESTNVTWRMNMELIFFVECFGADATRALD